VGFKNSAALAASPSALVQVTQMYVGKPIAVILGFAAVVSAFSAAVCDGFLSRRLAETEHTQRSPIAALAVLAIPALLLSIGFVWTSPANAFNYTGGTGGFLYTFIYCASPQRVSGISGGAASTGTRCWR
jgi:amino acid transporter